MTVLGPFNTDDVMRPLPRLAYWTVLVTLSYAAGYGANLLADRMAEARIAKRIAIAGPVTAVAVFAIVFVLNGLALGYWATGRAAFMLAANVAVISIVIAAVFQIAYGLETSAPDAFPPTPPPLLDRLPFDKRAPLVAISVEDHYVRIQTTKGEDMILLRLADAIREVGDTHGTQVHRSHWIAFDQVVVATRKGDGATLTMSNGTDIPVSRANVAKIREAGLLPRT